MTAQQRRAEQRRRTWGDNWPQPHERPRATREGLQTLFNGTDAEPAPPEPPAAADPERLAGAVATALERLGTALERLDRQEQRLDALPTAVEELVARRLRELSDGAVAAPAPEAAEAPAHLLFVPGSAAYRLVARDGPAPRPGAVVVLDDVAAPLVVTRVGPSPLPADSRRCAYLQHGPGEIPRTGEETPPPPDP